MENWICVTCGVQYAASEQPPARCPICEDQRQYVGYQGQQWTTLDGMRAAGYRNTITEEEPGLTGIVTEPSFAIGQRALLVQTPMGNVLWDCITYLDDETARAVEDLGGIVAIAASHPHLYGAMISWAERFQASIYLHEADRRWMMRPDERITFWSGETLPLPGDLTLARLGGHFPGSSVLHWPAGGGGKGALLTGDTIYVVTDRAWVSFMYSYPNLIPLPARVIRRMRDAIAPYHFDRLYAGFAGRVVQTDASAAVQRSADRYLKAIEEGLEGDEG